MIKNGDVHLFRKDEQKKKAKKKKMNTKMTKNFSLILKKIIIIKKVISLLVDLKRLKKGCFTWFWENVLATFKNGSTLSLLYTY